MISTLIILFISCFSILIFYLFNTGFVRGELFDITETNPKKGSKLEKFLKEIEEGIKYINNTKHELVYIQSDDGLKLVAKYFKNENLYSNKLIILFHGYRSVAENDFGPIFKLYYLLGYNILLVDQRAHGRSEGKYITFGIKERYDCVRWCEYAAENIEGIDEIILAGNSMGATTVLLASGLELPSKVKGVIADCGFTSPKDIISKVVNVRSGVEMAVLLPFVNILCKLIAKFDLYECSVMDAMEKNKLPVLFIHGRCDDFVPSSMSVRNFECCNSRKKLLLTECVNHARSYLAEKIRIQTEIKDFMLSL